MIGTHIDDDIDNLTSYAKKVKLSGGKCVQLFVKAVVKNYVEYQNKYLEFKTFLEKNNMQCIVHASYTINCSNNWSENESWWINQFIEEIKCADLIGAVGIVIHLGKQIQMDKETALNNMYTSLLYIHTKTIECKTMIFVETSTGQGNEICYQLEDLAHFYRKIMSHRDKNVRKRFGICIDTCHIFAAGYDIRNPHVISQYLDRFDELIGLSEIKLIHLNDSKGELNSKIDRHDNLGNGKIGKDSLLHFAKIFIKMNIPVILETPHEKIFDDLKIVLNSLKNKKNSQHRVKT